GRARPAGGRRRTRRAAARAAGGTARAPTAPPRRAPAARPRARLWRFGPARAPTVVHLGAHPTGDVSHLRPAERPPVGHPWGPSAFIGPNAPSRPAPPPRRAPAPVRPRAGRAA